MNIADYQAAIDDMPLYDDLCYGAITELGEVVDVIKKGSRPGREIDIQHLGEEIGDTFWYLVRLASKYGLSVEVLLQDNVDKLVKRHAENAN